MRALCLTTGAMAMLILASCCTPPTYPVVASDNRPRPISDIRIAHTLWVCPKSGAAETIKVQDHMQRFCRGQSYCVFDVTPTHPAIGEDPHPGCVKRLEVDYHCGETAMPTVIRNEGVGFIQRMELSCL